MNHEIELTREERRAIAALERLAQKWPKSLTLFSWSGDLVVMKYPKGHDMMSAGNNGFVVANISGIPNDGGDPN